MKVTEGRDGEGRAVEEHAAKPPPPACASFLLTEVVSIVAAGKGGRYLTDSDV